MPISFHYGFIIIFQVTFFSKIGGSCLSKCVYNILKRTISRDLQGKLRYTSQSGKVCFGDSLLADAIRGKINGLFWNIHTLNKNLKFLNVFFVNCRGCPENAYSEGTDFV